MVSLGLQDEYLIGNPQITFFKTVYRRHTNFAIETIEQVIDGVKDTDTYETIGVVNISKTGDLLTNVYVTCNQNLNGIKGNKLIQEVELIIGGTIIDKHTSEWMDIYNELYIPESKQLGFKYMSGGFDNINNSILPQLPVQLKNLQYYPTFLDQKIIILPLKFFFCNNFAQALPIIALQYHDVSIKFKWGYNNQINRNKEIVSSVSCEVWGDYIYLDTDERKRFSESSHEYLIEQLQYKEFINENRKFVLPFNHPVKSLFWTEKELIKTQKANINLNGTERFYKQSKEYFQLKQPFDHFTSIPGNNIKEKNKIQFIKPYHLSYLNTYNHWFVASPSPQDGVHPLNQYLNNPEGTTPSKGQFVEIVSNYEDDSTLLQFIHPPSNIEGIYNPGKCLDVQKGDIISISISVKYHSGGDNDNDNDVYGHEGYNTTFISQIDSIIDNIIPSQTHTPSWNKNTKIIIKPNIKLYTEGEEGDLNILKHKFIARFSVIARYSSPNSNCSNLNKNINCYSFSLNPVEHQPSGTCNFSKIDDIKLVFDDIVPANINNPLIVYALNYNVLRIKNGMGGLAYSN